MTIISHSLKLIFLRTRKTASTSIEYALIPYLDRRDLIATSTGAEPLDHPWWRTPNRTSRRIGNEVELKARLARLGLRRFGLYKHEPAAGVRALVSRRAWEAYHKLSVERHPYDRVISMWQYRTRHHDPRPPIAKFVRWLERQRRRGDQWQDKGDKWQLFSNWPIYAIGDEVVADQVIRWEDLPTELPETLRRFGIEQVTLGRHKSGHRDPAATVDILDQESRERIVALYAREFEVFGYEP